MWVDGGDGDSRPRMLIMTVALCGYADDGYVGELDEKSMEESGACCHGCMIECG